MTIPPEIIKISTIERIDNGFTISGTDKNKNKYEVFRIICVTNDELKEINKNQSSYIEKAVSNKEKTVIIKFPTDDTAHDENAETIEKIMDELNTIKKNVRLK